jgi:Spondin_N
VRSASAFPIALSVILASVVSAAVVAAPVVIESSASATLRADRVGTQTEIVLPPSPTALYRVTIVSEWSTSSHPTTLPTRSHFSPTVVAVHSAVADLINPGTLATPGIKSMAETGATATLEAELASDATVTAVRTGSNLFGVGSQSFEVTVAQEAPLVSLVTMLAPSPDWFIGIEDESLFTAGKWLDRIDIDLEAYDSGTDSGADFGSGNLATNPPQPIAGPVDAAYATAVAEGRFGFVSIERLT